MRARTPAGSEPTVDRLVEAVSKTVLQRPVVSGYNAPPALPERPARSAASAAAGAREKDAKLPASERDALGGPGRQASSRAGAFGAAARGCDADDAVGPPRDPWRCPPPKSSHELWKRLNPSYSEGEPEVSTYDDHHTYDPSLVTKDPQVGWKHHLLMTDFSEWSEEKSRQRLNALTASASH